ncbi:MAG TPA: hypothetical protein VL172_05220, partial [Kofleriaceae bacterium]|nr:hypothetical protein [Kofleriaceae bacterium]
MTRVGSRSWCIGVLAVVVAAGCGGGGKDPGALVAVTTSGRVGVLLDEYPEAARDDVADALLGEDDAFWVERVRRQ